MCSLDTHLTFFLQLLTQVQVIILWSHVPGREGLELPSKLHNRPGLLPEIQ